MAVYKTFGLEESFRTERGASQRTVLNLGAGFSLPEGQWKALANRNHHRDELEEYLRRQEKGLFGLQETVILYDLTNCVIPREVAESFFSVRSESRLTPCRQFSLLIFA